MVPLLSLMKSLYLSTLNSTAEIKKVVCSEFPSKKVNPFINIDGAQFQVNKIWNFDNYRWCLLYWK
jgi:hypothetical protein